MALDGMRVVFTGALPIVRTEAAAIAREMGATVQTTVTSTTDILVTASKDMKTAKMATAKAKKLEIWTGQEFMDAVEDFKDGGSDAKTAKKNKKKKKKEVLSSGEEEDDEEEEESPSKKAKKNVPNGHNNHGYEDVTLYYNRGGKKVAIAREIGYAAAADDPQFVADGGNARHLALAPLDSVPKVLNCVIETPSPESPAFAVMAALGIHSAYHDAAVLQPLKPSTLGSGHAVWKALKGFKDPFLLRFEGDEEEDVAVPSCPPCFYGAIAPGGYIVGRVACNLE